MSDGRSLSHDTLEQYRFAAIKLHESGVQVSTIAKSLQITRQSVYQWIRKKKKDGLKSLRAAKSDGPASRLTCTQWIALRTMLRRPATELGYSTDLWSGPRIRHLLKHRLKVIYHPKHIPRLLKRLGLELKFPERRALEQDPIAVRKWKRSRLPEILAYAGKRRALMFYADEALVSLIPYVGKSWTEPGKTPVVRVSGQRGQNIGITAAVNQQGRMCFELTRAKERFTARVFVRFMGKLHKECPKRNIVLIVDGASVHKAKIVKEYVLRNNSWLRLEILPAYSPELNPTEKSWRFIKTKKLNGSIARDSNELRKQTTKILRETKNRPKRVASFFDNIVI